MKGIAIHTALSVHQSCGSLAGTCPGYSCPGDEGRPSLDGVCTALETCLENRADYISMSIGSENWLETSKLAASTNKQEPLYNHAGMVHN